MAEADAAICQHAVSLARNVDTVAGYVPLPNEPGGPSLPEYLSGVCRRLLLPVVLPDRDLDWALFAGGLAPGPFGLREPAGPRLGPSAITKAQLILVPAVALARQVLAGGWRALSRVRAGFVAALVYDEELVPAVPADPHDVRVQAVVTPSGITRM